MTLKELVEHRKGAHGAISEALAKLRKLEEKGVNSQYLRDALSILKAYRYECIMCLTPVQEQKSFMVRKAIWDKEVGNPDVHICLPCFEQLIGREVEEADLQKDRYGAHLPINYHLTEQVDLKTSVIENHEEHAMRQRENEKHFAGILDRMLTTEQKRFLKENPDGHLAGYGVTGNAIESHKKHKRGQKGRKKK